MSSFLEENQDFVLKLKIKKSDGQTQIRRVRLPRIADTNGSVSYAELVGLVVVFTFPEASSDDVPSYNVSLTYYDVDGDSVTIASTDELLDACEQFVGQKVLRITTYVKPKTGGISALPGEKKTPSSPSLKMDRGTSTRGDTLVDRIDDAITPIVTVLAATLGNVLSEALKLKPEKSSTATTMPYQVKSDEKEKSEKNTADGDEEKTSSQPVGEAKEKEEDDDNEKDVVSPEKPLDIASANVEDKPNGPPSDKSPSNDLSGEVDDEADDSKPFIHGRHTCDSCLTTPIIGKRYHSTNLRDYDLCGNCFRNYKGSEIQFEAVELDRDRIAQDRWYRRCNRSEMMLNRRGRFGHGPRGRRCDLAGAPRGRFANRHPGCPPPVPPGPHGCRLPLPPPGPPLPPPPPHHMGPGGFQHHWAHLGPHMGPHMHHHGNGLSTEFDSALKEAIRRSLSDIAAKEATVNKNIDSCVKPSAPMESDVKNEEPVAGAKENQESIKVETVNENEEEKDAVVNNIPRSVEILKESADEDVNEDLPSLEDYEEDNDSEEVSLDEDSVDSERLVAEAENKGLFTSPPCKGFSTPRKHSDSTKDESFASDAKGAGEAAEAMGVALDRVAGVITEMLFESTGDLKPSAVQDNEANKDVRASGELIVNSTDTPHDNASEGESEWSVVESVHSSETTESEQIAKAAEMLGSALFNSDMKSSAENASGVSVSDGGSSFSVPSSVPTDLGANNSHAALAQINRWGVYLAQLRELGFEDEDECVEVLERLDAANIGVDAEDDISINHVVNELLEKQNK